MALEPSQRDAVGGVELALAAQQLAQPQEDATVRILGELGGQGLDLVRHACPSRRGSGPPPWRGARRRAASAPRPSGAPAVPTGPTARPPRRTGPWRPVRTRARGARRPRADRAAARAAALPRHRPRGRTRARAARAAGARPGRGDGRPPPARPRPAPLPGPGPVAPPPRPPPPRPGRRHAWS